MSVGKETLARTCAIIEEGIEKGQHLGAQLYVSRGGDAAREVLADLAFGEVEAGSEGQPGVPMRDDTLTLWFSASKPLTAVGWAILWERGAFDLDTRVAEVIPEFAQNGKESITFRHILTHRAGFMIPRLKWPDMTWDETIADICQTGIVEGWEVGRSAGYDQQTSWYILGEAIRRGDAKTGGGGRTYGQFMREELFIPLGMNETYFGMPQERYEKYEGNRSPNYATLEFKYERDRAGKPPYDGHHHYLKEFPGGGGSGPIRELGCFYEMLAGRGERNGTRVLKPQTVEALTAAHRVGIPDQTFRFNYRWGLGFMLTTRIEKVRQLSYDFGGFASPRTFGHGGFQSSIGFCDPHYDLCVAWVCNGMPTETHHRRRNHAINTAIYEDLGLATDKWPETIEPVSTSK